MSKKLFTLEEMEILRKNPYVKKVSEKGITYTEELKEYFIEKYSQGKGPTEILRSVGFDTKILGISRVRSLKKRIKRMLKRPEGVKDLRKERSGRPATKGMTPEEEIQRLKQKIKYLEQENTFLKKIEFIDKKAELKQKRKKSSKSSKK